MMTVAGRPDNPTGNNAGEARLSGVTEGIRTPDIQDHNLAL